MFEQIPAEVSGVHFTNTVLENDTFNILEDEFMYNGGGVGIADFNQDGLQDLYFAGNLVANKLYLNKGNFHFEDVTEASGTAAGDVWSSGVSVVDINGDQLPDIYLSATHDKAPQRRRNKLYINQGNDPSGVPRFVDQAEAYGLADTSYTTHAAFFDYDLDGDLDVYLLIDQMLLKRSSTIERIKSDGSSLTTDKLLRNDGIPASLGGDGKGFTDVSREAGILLEGFGLGVAIFDVNQDHYPDIYVSNDFITNDVLYVNQQDGTFVNEIERYMQHQSYSSMGNDVADINQDGLPDLMTLDMLPNTNQREKQMMNQSRYLFYDLLERKDYQMQYVRNCLQLNRGDGFSEVGQLAGVSATDWSWSVLMTDYDNDGLTDIFISNGFPRDVTDQDFSDFRSDVKGRFSSTETVLSQIPEVKIHNFFYRNLGNLRFEDVSEAWGIEQPSFSNGAAYGDLDNDGDLDLVVNNINDSAFIYRNQARQLQPGSHYLRLKLKGPPLNTQGLGSKIWLKVGEKSYYWEHSSYRGYISTMEPFIHFGLGMASQVEELRLRWPDGKENRLKELAVDQVLEIDYDKAVLVEPTDTVEQPPLFVRVDSSSGLNFRHSESIFQDFGVQVLLPHKLSQEGPGMAVYDLNQDGRQDLLIGNGRMHAARIFLQQPAGNFISLELADTSDTEDMGIGVFDVNGDSVPDVYVASGSSEFAAHSAHYQDRLFFNQGAGKLQQAEAALPEVPISSSTVNAADFDRDGDLDVFVGGRMVPQSYPMPERSMLLRNEQGHFSDATAEVCPELMKLGMVTAALWTDFNRDGWVDLLVVGEWMPITFFENQQGRLVRTTPPLTLDHPLNKGKARKLKPGQSRGWWNSITSGDFDLDGDVDYLLGNQGLNNRFKVSLEHPLKVYAKDFDKNGSVDHIIAAYRQGNYYPIHLRNDFIRQLNHMRRRFFKYADYAQATLTDIFTEEELAGAYYAEAAMMESMYMENREGVFVLHPLPTAVQFAPVYGMVVQDFNGDRFPDALLVGNRFGTETFSGRHDASLGNVLLGDGQGHFRALNPRQSGMRIDGDAKSAAWLPMSGGNYYLLVAQNNDSLLVFEPRQSVPGGRLHAGPLDYGCLITYKNGKQEMRELPYGSGYLSQQARQVLLDPSEVEKIQIWDYAGNARTITPERVSPHAQLP